MPRCSVYGCKSKSGFRPTDEESSNNWKQAIGYAGQVSDVNLFLNWKLQSAIFI